MQTLPNIKLINATPSHTNVLSSTPEILPENDEAACMQQRQQQGLPGKTRAFVKRMSEGRFFQTDRSPCRRTTNSILRPSPLLVTSAPTTTTSDAERLQQLHVALNATSQPVGVDVVLRQQPKDVVIDDGGTGLGNSPATRLVQMPTDAVDHLDQGERVRHREAEKQPNTTVDNNDDDDVSTPLALTSDH